VSQKYWSHVTHGNLKLFWPFRTTGQVRQARQEIVDNVADFAKTDPADIGFLREIIALPGMLAGPRAAVGAAEEGAAAEAETGAAAAEAAAENPWKMGWAKRGIYLSEKLGANLPPLLE